MDRDLAEKLVELLREAHGLLHDATAVLSQAPKGTEMYEVKLLKPIYGQYPDMESQ